MKDFETVYGIQAYFKGHINSWINICYTGVNGEYIDIPVAGTKESVEEVMQEILTKCPERRGRYRIVKREETPWEPVD